MIDFLFPSHIPIIIRIFAAMAPFFWLGLLVGTWIIRWRGSSKRARVIHMYWQGSMVLLLILTFLVFEYELQVIGWRHIAQFSPYYGSWVFPVLFIHLFFALFAVFTLFLMLHDLWGKKALRILALPIEDLSYHRKLGQRFLRLLFMTWVTGWWVYFIAFLAAKGFNGNDL